MELAGWNQLLANEDFPTGLGLGEEGWSCRLDSWPDCPLGREPVEGERAALSDHPPTTQTLLTGFGSGAFATSACPLSPGFVSVLTSGLIPTSRPDESTDPQISQSNLLMGLNSRGKGKMKMA